VTRRFSATAGVEDVSFSVAPGELLALVGASGSGKTTTLRIIAGYETADSGRVLLSGEDITRVPPQRRSFGMVFQHYALFPHMNVEENVAFGLEARGVARGERAERARRALASVGLEGAGPRPVQSLSGGEQQSVAVARALIIDPRALLLDEPLSNLDPTLRQQMRGELSTMLHRANVPAVLVTHDQEDAFAVADRSRCCARAECCRLERRRRSTASRPRSRSPGSSAGEPCFRRCAKVGRCSSGRGRRGGWSRRRSVRSPAMASCTPCSGPSRCDSRAPMPPGRGPGRRARRRFAGSVFLVGVELDDGTHVEVEAARPPAIGERVGVQPADVPVPLFRE
jgi:ABC-type nitrate/sulfonate/bicarbonate transport system ATPase subunit